MIFSDSRYQQSLLFTEPQCFLCLAEAARDAVAGGARLWGGRKPAVTRASAIITVGAAGRLEGRRRSDDVDEGV